VRKQHLAINLKMKKLKVLTTIYLMQTFWKTLVLKNTKRKIILEYLLLRLRINIHIIKLSLSIVEILKFRDLQQASKLIESQMNMINIMNI
jgi:hypothetical protein